MRSEVPSMSVILRNVSLRGAVTVLMARPGCTQVTSFNPETQLCCPRPQSCRSQHRTPAGTPGFLPGHCCHLLR